MIAQEIEWESGKRRRIGDRGRERKRERQREREG